MTRSSRFVLPFALIALAASLAVGVPRAAAIDPFPTTGIATLASDHFTVHYSRDEAPCPSAYITQEQAGEILGMAERAYTLYNGWGYTPPVASVDISVDDFATNCVQFGSLTPASISDRWDASITPLAPGVDQVHLNKVRNGLDYHVIAHEVFHLFEDAGTPAGADPWLEEGLAEWASVRANGAASVREQNPDRTMDCVGSECGDSEFDRNGYPGWMLFEYLAETDAAYNANDQTSKAVKVKAVFDAGASMNGTHALSSVVSPTPLGKFFEDYTTARLTANFRFDALAGVLPKTQGSIVVGSATGALSPVTLAVNHLAVRFVDLAHGLDTDTGPCFAAWLDLKVTLPAGVATTPYYSANVKGSAPQAFTVSGNTATLNDISWNTCGASPHAYVSLPNESNDVAPSVALDGREFSVSGTVAVDKNTPASASEAPAGVKVTGPVIQTPTSDPAPELTLHAPELMRVSAKTRLLRFIVFSSGDGTLKATLGSTWLGSAGLHAGNNDVRYILPTRLLKSLRKTNTPANVLTLTSYSSGGTQGASVNRRVAMKRRAEAEAQEAQQVASKVASWRPTGSFSQSQRSRPQASGWRSRTSSTPQG